jgi:uncharacterized membrane protein (DUF373 family)
MPDMDALKRSWRRYASYERFENIVGRIIMLFVSVVIVYSLVLVGIELVYDFQLGSGFLDKELLQDIFGSILTVLILLEFNHSIGVALARRSGIIQARIVVLIAILVVARKFILIDFTTARVELLAGLSGVALALGVLYWLIGAAAERHEPPPGRTAG